VVKDDRLRYGASSTTGSASSVPVYFVDARGERWSVTERDTRGEPGTRADSCLVFSGENTIRRVWHFPANWRSLSPEQLESLAERS
jgi:hypothetical protein